MAEPFCACGHAEAYHRDDGARVCEAIEPDPRCSCAGYRPGRRSRPQTIDGVPVTTGPRHALREGTGPRLGRWTFEARP